MVEIHLRQVGFGYSAYGTITKNKERTQKIKKTNLKKNRRFKIHLSK